MPPFHNVSFMLFFLYLIHTLTIQIERGNENTSGDLFNVHFIKFTLNPLRHSRLCLRARTYLGQIFIF